MHRDDTDRLSRVFGLVRQAEGCVQSIPRHHLIAIGLLMLFSMFLLNQSGGGPPAASAATPPNTGEVLVKFKAPASEQAIAALNASMATTQVDTIPALGVRVLRLPGGQDAGAVAAAYARNPLVQFAEVNWLAQALDTVPNDPQFSANQWGLKMVQGPSAWDITTGSSAVVIAILDTGTWPGHPDLAGKVLAGYNAIDGSTNAADDNGHGTWVSGVAAAQTNNGIGMAGMSWGSPVMPVKVCDSTGSCAFSNVAKGMTWAADHGAKVINLSLGGTASCGGTLQSAADYAWSKGVFMAAASGNEGAPVDAPANCNHVLAVGATDSTDTRTSWSNFGAGLALVAPGAGIICPTLSGSYASCSGTSVASPHVAGAASLLMAQGASNSAAVTALEAGVDDLGAAGWDQYFGWGRLNVFKALLALGGAPAATATPSATSTPASSPTPAPTATPAATSTPASSPAPTGTSAPPAPSSDTTPPTVVLVAPGAGQTVRGMVGISANASDSFGVVRVEFYIDGVLLKTDTGAPYSTNWNTRRAANGGHTIAVKAYDAAGNSASDSHTVTVSN